MRSTALLIMLVVSFPLIAGEVEVRPTPAWVERLEVDAAPAIEKENVRWGIYDLLADHQVRTGDGAESQYWRTVRKVLSPSGVQNASELSLDYDPSFQRLVVHEVTIVRDGVRIDALAPDEIRVIEKEDDAENRIYDGQRTALLFLRDVRAGDVLDYSWSIEGANPILGGRYTDEYDLSSSVPAHYLRHRLVWPLGRPLQWQGGDPAIEIDGGSQVMTWERSDVPALAVEDALPSWYEPWDSIQVTEFASWNEVARWAAAMFALDDRSRDAVHRLAERIRAQHRGRDAQVTAAIRFVQDEIRYLGIEMGRNSHQPHPPWETLEQRWGDCKDKTLLLVAVLRELGMQAWPALVSTRLQHRIDQKLASPFLFDHVIALVVDGGKSYWIDSTIADQGGTLATIETPNDGRALVVRENTTGTTPVTTNQRGSTVVEQTYTTTDYHASVLLTMRTTWSGADADAMRAELATLSLEDFAGDRINRLAIDQPKIEANGLPKIEDDRHRNVIVVTESYNLPEFWSEGEWSWFPRVVESYLGRPEIMIRSMPLAFAWPLHVEQRVTFEFPEDVNVERSHAVTESPAFRYETTIDSNGRTVSVRHSLRSRRDALTADEVPEHLTKIAAVMSEAGFRLAPPGARGGGRSHAAALALRWGGGFAAVLLFVALSWWLATRKRPMLPAPLPQTAPAGFLPGDAPSSALLVSGFDEMNAHLESRPCHCGVSRLFSTDVQRARYADREMTIVVRRCDACGREQSTYFTAA